MSDKIPWRSENLCPETIHAINWGKSDSKITFSNCSIVACSIAACIASPSATRDDVKNAIGLLWEANLSLCLSKKLHSSPAALSSFFQAASDRQTTSGVPWICRVVLIGFKDMTFNWASFHSLASQIALVAVSWA